MKKIIMILGHGHSGSTVLDKALGSNPHHFSMGELSTFNRLFRDFHGKFLCGCGDNLIDCPFWTKVIQNLNSRLGINYLSDVSSFDVELISSSQKELAIENLLLNSLGLRKMPQSILDKIQNNRILYDEVFKATGAKVLVDSSKNIVRAWLLKKHLKDYEFKFIYLVRDGRAVLNSYLKETYSIKKTKANEKNEEAVTYKRTPSEPNAVINNWKNSNMKSILFLNFIAKRKYLLVRHEDFCNSPQRTMKEIGSYVGISYDHFENKLDRKENHIFGGNSSRINALTIRKSSESWRSSLDEELISVFNKKAGWINKYFGFDL